MRDGRRRWPPASSRRRSNVWNLTAPLRAYHHRGSPGEHIHPAHPSLLVGNHTLFGVLDVPHMLAKIYKERGVYVRSLGDRLHFQIPGWGSS